MDYTAVVTDWLSFGRYPYPPLKAIKELELEGYNIFIDLTDDLDKVTPYKEYLSDDSIYYSYPIRDQMSPPSQEGVTKLIETVIRDGNKKNIKIYVHCRGGHGRAGLITGCFLKYAGDKNPLKTVYSAHQRRKNMKTRWRKMGSPQRKSQKEFVNNFNI